MDEVFGFCVRMLGPGEAARAAEEAARAAGHGDRVTVLAAAAAECREREGSAVSEDRDAGRREEVSDSPGPLRPTDPASAEVDRGAEVNRGAEVDRGAEPATEDPEGPTEPKAGDDPRDSQSAAASAPDATDQPGTLAEAVAAELAQATARLPERQREALALRELLGLHHGELGRVVGVDTVAVAPLLARARLRLRTELRGESPPAPECPERERALRTIALRQDGEDVPSADDDWLVEHLGHCEGCGRAHAAMFEASACYRAWRLPETESATAAE
jgi:DNA-directed RNA polymerase specialized sigma24 family protein